MAKGPHAFRTISEAAEELGVPQHVLRFWESRFSFIRPMKRAGGRRFYRPQDIAVLAGVRALLHDEGYTIKGVQKLHKEQGLRRILGGEADRAAPPADIAQAGPPSAPVQAPPTPVAAPRPGAMKPEARVRLHRALNDLTSVQARLDALLRGE